MRRVMRRIMRTNMRKSLCICLAALTLLAVSAQASEPHMTGKLTDTAAEDPTGRTTDTLPESLPDEPTDMPVESLPGEPTDGPTDIPPESLPDEPTGIPENEQPGDELTGDEQPGDKETGDKETGDEEPEDFTSPETDKGELPSSADTSDPFQDGGLTVLTEENADLFSAGDEASEEILEQLQEGEIIGLAPVALTDEMITEGVSVCSEDSGAELFSVPAGSYSIEFGARINSDEIWTKENDGVGGNNTRDGVYYRTLHYTDSDGRRNSSPLYCLNANKPGYNGDAQMQNEAVKALTDVRLQKILYFGYGGPGDICGSYDPSCSHINWAKWQNRFVFTHQALSKLYSGEVGRATAQEQEHVGLNRFISYLTSLTIPSHTGTRISALTAGGTQETGTDLTLAMRLVRKPSEEEYPYLREDLKNGFQSSGLITISDQQNSKNGLQVRDFQNSGCQILYWVSEEDFRNRTLKNPRILTDGETIQLQSGAKFCVIEPLSVTWNRTFRYEMILKPVSYFWLDADVQFHTDLQDLGAYTYQGARQQISFTLQPAPKGSLALVKSDSLTKQKVADAGYTLYAAEDLYSGGVLCVSKGEAVEEQFTDENGSLLFSNLIPGAYTLQETKSPPGYYPDERVYPVSISNSTGTIEVTDDPIPTADGSLTVSKRIRAEDVIWAHGCPTFTFSVSGTDIYGYSHHYEQSVCFTRENLSADESGYAVLSCRFEALPFGTYRVTEHPVLRYYLSDIYSSSSNVTLSLPEHSGYGTPTQNTGYAEAVLQASAPEAEVTFVNEKSRFDDYSHNSYVQNVIPLIWDAPVFSD